MQQTRQKNTSAEMVIRRELHRRGLRYRVGYTVSSKPRRVADIVFTRQRLVVFVDGCFWHGCPLHGTWPKNNAEFWRNKIETNRQRDSDTNRRLTTLGWHVLRVWEHEPAAEAADRIERELKELKGEAAQCRGQSPDTEGASHVGSVGRDSGSRKSGGGPRTGPTG
ncbi:very short patch repair endonuclease [Billgrantia montanilacus]|uniref:Very short patch repair endonuclease n=1 Tax=Billgrantia montanilacus TaxID=2282305 RepID=A0A368TUV5_9GAMM|nr:very short patch repair endonuclease [Halomonas montanilacus]RCV86923.1 very short patch repair endonuclease [Halomonas montanilacus]